MRLSTICATVFLSMPSLAQSLRSFDAPICDPRTDSSADKVWSVRIEPLDLNGQGETRYAFSRDGAPTWSGNLPVFLTQSLVTKTGTLAGWGWTGDPGEIRAGVLHVVIVAHDGKVLLNESTPRQVPLPTCMLVEEIDPHVFSISGLLALEEQDLAIVRFHDGEAQRSGEEWRRYRLSTGQAIDRFRPRTRLANARPIDWNIVMRIIPSTPLVLSQWDRRDPEGKWGLSWFVCDAEANAVWELDLPTDISGIGDDGYKVFDEVNDAPNGGILALADRTFEIRLCEASKRARFEVVRAADGTWSVREVERTDYHAATAKTPLLESAKPVVEPTKPLEPIGSIDLCAGDPPRSAVHDIGDFDLDDQGRFVYSRRVVRSQEFDIVRVRADGTELDVHRLPQRADAQGYWSGEVRWIHGDTLIAMWQISPHGEALCVFSLADGSLRELPESLGYNSHQIERTADGGFIVLCDTGLMSFDADCRLRWRRTKSEQLCGGEKFAQDARGRIVVLDYHYDDKTAIQHVSPDGRIGRYERLLDLPPSHNGSIRADPHGDWWLTCAAGWVRVDGTGRCARPLQVKLPDGKPLGLGCMRAIADGSMWVSSDGSLFHVTSKLEVDRVIGDYTDELALREASLVHVTADGRVYAVSGRTADVFVLDDKGKRLRTARADASDFPDGVDGYYGYLDVREDGSMLVGKDGGIGSERGTGVAFDAECKRLGAPSTTQRPRPRQAKTGRTWSTDKGVALLDPNGDVVRRVEKALDGSWLIAYGKPTAADDGTLAAFIRQGADGNALATFGDKGELKHVCPVDKGFVQELAWDGKRAAFIADKKLCIVDAASGTRKTLTIATDGFEPSGYSEIFLVRGGSEVWLFDGRSKIHRYAVPRFD